MQESYGNRLRGSIRETVPFCLVGVYDMLSARVAAVRAVGLFVSGAGFAASFYGLPDIGYTSWSDLVSFVERLRFAFPRDHILVDIDDGYGDVELTGHVVSRLSAAGASGVIVEDQARPRKFGHLPGKRIVSIDEYHERLSWVIDHAHDMVVVARTDAETSVEQIRRVRSIARTRADAVMVAGLQSARAVKDIKAAAGGKTVVFDQAVGTSSSYIRTAELVAVGVDVILYTTGLLVASHAGMDAALEAWCERDSAPSAVSTSEIERLRAVLGPWHSAESPNG